MVTYKKSYNNNKPSLKPHFYPHRSHNRSSSSSRSKRSTGSGWSRVIVFGVLIFSIYFLILGLISYVAISSNRNSGGGGGASGGGGGPPYFYKLMHKNGTIVDVDYDALRSGVLNATLLQSNGLIALDRIGNIQFNTMSRQNGVLGAELLRSQIIFKCTKRPIRFREPGEQQPPVALVSFPGSGNTWLRYLLQLATGIYTGSVYKDFALLRNGFPGEYVKDGRVLAVKTHEIGAVVRSRYERAILLVRSPQEAILAEFNRRNAGHIGQAGREKYRRSEGRLWSQFVVQKAEAWTETNLDWIENFQGPLLIIAYSQLVANISSELNTVLNFLQESVSDDVMDCVLRNQEGIYRRRKKPLRFNPFTATMLRLLATKEKMVAEAIEKRTTKKLDQLHWKTRLRRESAFTAS